VCDRDQRYKSVAPLTSKPGAAREMRQKKTITAGRKIQVHAREHEREREYVYLDVFLGRGLSRT